MKSSKTWIIIFTVLCLVSAASWLMLSHTQRGNTVGIYQDGKLIETVDLGKVKESYELVFDYNGSTNTVIVDHDYIAVKEADCRDNTCVKHGPLTDSAAPIICLPNRLVIKYISGSVNVDAVAGMAG